MKIVLASNSPRRKELLERLEVSFSVEGSNIDEVVREGEAPTQVAMGLALQKALDIAENHGDDTLIIAADTIVFDQVIMGKPKSEEDAKHMLHQLNGKVHEVITGIAIVQAGTLNKIAAYERTMVKFKQVTTEKIDRYVASGEPFGKAGSYAIQGKGMTLVEWIQGDYNNVVGLPVGLLEDLLERHFGLFFL